MQLDTARAQVATMLSADPGKHPFLEKVTGVSDCQGACSLRSRLQVAQSTASMMACQWQQRAVMHVLSHQTLLPGRTARAFHGAGGCNVHAPPSGSPLRGRAQFVWLATRSPPPFCR